MNPLTNMKNVTKLSERELQNNGKSSWHDQYRDSAWIFIGGLPFDLTEGDIICIFSQYGEVVNINLIRDKDTGKSKGFCFLCYEDQRSTVLSVDNLNGIKVLNRILRVDHVSEYKIPKEGKKTGEETKKLYNEGCAPKAVVPVIRNPLVDNLEYRRETLADQIQADIKLPARLPIRCVDIKKEIDSEQAVEVKIEPKSEEEKSANQSVVEDDKSERKKKKSHRKHRSSNSDSDDSNRKKHTDRKSKKRDRSESKERHVQLAERSRDSKRYDVKNIKTKPKYRSRSRSLERKHQSSRFRENDSKRYGETRSNYDKNKYEDSRGSRS